MLESVEELNRATDARIRDLEYEISRLKLEAHDRMERYWQARRDYASKLRSNGLTLAAIGEEMGISKERVGKLLLKNYIDAGSPSW